ncbi:MAG: hypothetical protein JWM68_5069 [Verrucomicrobiales bacterium]|nr:hypothetical protein [Verrucomicrobiales bacterium]
MLREFLRGRPIANVLILIALSCVTRLSAKTEIDAAQVRKIAAMLPKHAMGLGEVASHRESWSKLAKEAVFEHWLAAAHAKLAVEDPKATDDLYLDFSRTGNRNHWQDVEFATRSRLTTFALAECLEDKGAFLQPLEAMIKEVCAERTWVFPAHDRSLGNFNQTQIDIDLGSARVGWELATIKYLLGDKLSLATRKLISDNLQRRILKPYRDMVEGRVAENHWLRVNNNWNSVCLSGVVGAALAEIDSPEERAWFIASSQVYIKNFLIGFGSDGYCSEGMGYWNYGFGHFIMLSETIRQATGGEIDWLADPAVRLPALFGRRAEMLNGIYPSIADCHPASQPDPQIDTYICQRLGLKPCGDRNVFVQPASSLFTTTLFSFLPEKLPLIPGKPTEAESPLRTWFPDGGVLICRQPPNTKTPFAVSLKGGHNGENHNHNDL